MIQILNGDSRSMTRKEREMALRKDAILDAAREVFEKEGFFNTTMAQIAAKAEFGVGNALPVLPQQTAPLCRGDQAGPG